MERSTVQSSNVAAVGYHEPSQILEVEYHPSRNGRRAVWQYWPVTPEQYAELCTPGVSVGRFLHEQVKHNPRMTSVDVTPQEAR